MAVVSLRLEGSMMFQVRMFLRRAEHAQLLTPQPLSCQLNSDSIPEAGLRFAALGLGILQVL